MKGWQDIILEDALNYVQPTPYIVQSTHYDDSYETPVLTPGKSFLLGYTDETEGIYKNVPTIIFDDFTTAFKYVDFPFKVKSSAMKMLEVKSEEYDIKFLYYLMLTLNFEADEHKRYWISKYSKQRVKVPPLEEQKKIAGILDAADAYRQKTKALITKYDQLTQSLFLDMFGDPGKKEYPHTEYKMEDISNKVTDGDHATPKRTDSGYKLLSCRNVKQSFIDFDAGVDYVGEDEFKRMFKRCNPEKDDILISCSGTIGRTTAIRIDEPFVLVRSAALVKPKHELVNSIFLEKYLQTAYMQAVMLRKANTSSQANLFTGPIKSLPVLLPELSLQNQFEERVQAIESLKAKAEVSLAKAEDLFNSLLQRAFRGELV